MDNKNKTLTVQETKSINFQNDTNNQLGWYIALKDDMYRYRERRHPAWDENYMMYRDEVRINRLTQRQAVNIPLMKYTVRTLIDGIDNPPSLYFHSLNNDSQKELFYNTHWEEEARHNRLILKDIADKKQNLLYGRTFKSLGIGGGRTSIQVNDPQDILVNRYVDPTNINSARGLIHTNIFKPLSVVERNTDYNKQAVKNLHQWFATREGIGTLVSNMRRMIERNARLSSLGVTNLTAPMLGEMWINLDDAFLYKKDPATGKEVLFYMVVANEMEILLDVPLYKILGKTKDDFWHDNIPVCSWADDVDALDFWTDAVGDVMRKPNQILNAWFSQMVENRTLKNFGMQFFDASIQSDKPFNPDSFEPGPFKWFGVPGDPNKIIKRVDVDDLETNIAEMEFLMKICERASGATTVVQGVAPDQKVTLGEIRMLYQASQDRVKSFKVYYDESLEDLGTKYCKLLESAGDKLDPLLVSRKGKDGKGMYSYTLTQDHIRDPYGYVVEVKQKGVKDTEDQAQINKLNAAKLAMPMNNALDMIYKEKIAEFAGCTPDQVAQIMKEEQIIQQKMQQQQALQAAMPQAQPQIQPQNQQTSPKQNPIDPQLAANAAMSQRKQLPPPSMPGSTL